MNDNGDEKEETSGGVPTQVPPGDLADAVGSPPAETEMETEDEDDDDDGLGETGDDDEDADE